MGAKRQSRCLQLGGGVGGRNVPPSRGAPPTRTGGGPPGGSRVRAASVLPRAAGDTVWQSGEQRVEDSEGVQGALEKCWFRWGSTGPAGEVLVPLGKCRSPGGSADPAWGSAGPAGEVLVPRGKCWSRLGKFWSCGGSACTSGEVQVARRIRTWRPPPRPHLSSQADLPLPLPATVR